MEELQRTELTAPGPEEQSECLQGGLEQPAGWRTFTVLEMVG